MEFDYDTLDGLSQRAVALLSQQLQRFLDDRAWIENRRIMDLLHGIEAKALTLRDAPPAGTFMLPATGSRQRWTRPWWRASPGEAPVRTRRRSRAGRGCRG